jgi:hypothetical protein
MKIGRKTTLKQLACFVCGVLKNAGIDAILTGGSVVSIYTGGKYISYDLDFITHARTKDIKKVLGTVGFVKDGRYFKHPESDFFIEFPAPPVSIGNRPMTSFNELRNRYGYLKLLTPTQCVMDRLAAFYFWNDMQALTQAVLVASNNGIDMNEISAWSAEEGMEENFRSFKSELEKVKNPSGKR